MKGLKILNVIWVIVMLLCFIGACKTAEWKTIAISIIGFVFVLINANEWRKEIEDN